MSAQTRGDVLGLLERHGLHPRKILGQHFLADPNITRKIVAAAGIGPESRVLEIGAGTGTLTRELAAAGARVLAYEIDEGLRPLLSEVLEPFGAAEVRFEDAATADLGSALGAGPWSLVANLPYNVGTPILLDILRHVPAVTTMVVMVQREVADRLVAVPGSKTYGIPSVVVRLHADARLLFTVPPQVFVPAPRVGSAVLRLDRKDAPAAAERAIELASAGFGKRRKMLRSSLAPVLDDPVRVLEEAGLDPTARAEELSAEDFARLAEVADG
jgi:16S rRNA (adenine1518-N6/adenine1519-N6)-dimethyltransferase